MREYKEDVDGTRERDNRQGRKLDTVFGVSGLELSKMRTDKLV
jgi:hypothetical protein